MGYTDPAAAVARAQQLVGSVVASFLTDAEWTATAEGALLWDADGRLPGADGYVPTYEPYWLAADAAGMVATRRAGEDTTTALSVGGDSITVKPADLRIVEQGLRQRSPLWAYANAQAPALGVVRVDGSASHYVPTSRRRAL